MALVAYVVLALVCLEFRLEATPSIWLPSGLAMALAFRWGWSALPGLGLAAMLVAAWTHPGPIHVPVLLGTLASLEPLLVSLLVPLCLPQRDPFAEIRKLLLFVLLCMISGLLGMWLTGLLLPQVGGLPSPMSRMVGLLSLAPLLLVVMDTPARECWQDLGRLEWWLFLIAVVVAAKLPYGLASLRSTPFTFIVAIMLISAYRFSLPGITVLLLALAVIEIWLPSLSGIAIGARFYGLGLVYVQRVVAYVQVFALLLMVANQERRRMVADLQAQSRRLELMVAERTAELVSANTRLQRLSQRDGLTGIANRRRFEQVLRREWAEAKQRGETLALVMFDVDYFKAYNDHYGHQAGDRVLRQVARRLVVVLRSVRRPLIARYGGEEFVVLLPGLAVEEAAELAEALRQAVAQLAIEHMGGGAGGYVSLSGGMAAWVPQQGTRAASLVAAADTMLYVAKAAGRNRLCLHPEMDCAQLERSQQQQVWPRIGGRI